MLALLIKDNGGYNMGVVGTFALINLFLFIFTKNSCLHCRGIKLLSVLFRSHQN